MAQFPTIRHHHVDGYDNPIEAHHVSGEAFVAVERYGANVRVTAYNHPDYTDGDGQFYTTLTEIGQFGHFDDDAEQRESELVKRAQDLLRASTRQRRFAAVFERLGYGSMAEAARCGGFSARSIQMKCAEPDAKVREADVWWAERFEQIKRSESDG